MTTPLNRLIPVTDPQGRVLLQGEDTAEPLPGSIVMTDGYHGTAWQRLFSDGLWHSTLPGRQTVSWAQLCKRRNVVLVYDAEARVSGPARTERERVG